MLIHEQKNNNFVSKQDDFGKNNKNNDIQTFVTDSDEEIVFEGMTSLSGILHGIASGCSDRRILRVFFDRERVKKKEKEYRYLTAQAQTYGFSLQMTDREYLDAITTGTTHGGIVAVCSKRTFPSLEDAWRSSSLPFSKSDGFHVLLEGIEDPYNFGYTLRSLYAAGVDGVILSPRNWMAVAGTVAKSSAGASEQLPIAIADPVEAIGLYRKQGYRIVCAGIRDSVSMYQADLKVPLLLIVGGEKRGISSSVLSICDMIVRIDYGRAFKGSLSAASAATVLAFEILHQNSIKNSEDVR